MSVVLVEWLGRGGIAHTTEAWRRIAVDADVPVHVVSRTVDTLDSERSVSKRLPGPVGAIDAHLRLARVAAETIDEVAPDVVYLQNYWLPPIERRVVAAAQARGAEVVLAVHNARPHALRGGVAVGLRGLLEHVDTVVTHSSFVADQLQARFGVESVHVDLPAQTSIDALEPVEIREIADRTDGRPIAVFFGVVGRRYKGGDSLAALHQMVSKDWLVVAAGVGAASVTGAELAVDRYLTDGELRWLLEQADVALLPYRSASQSAAVVLAQMLGAPPIATAVGGIPRQIDDRETGLLLSASASTTDWARALRSIAADADWWDTVRSQAMSHVREQHQRSAIGWLSVVAIRG